EGLLPVAEQSGRNANELIGVLQGHPPWGAQADAALARVALVRGEREAAAEAARSTLASLSSAEREDVFLEIALPAAGVLLVAGTDEEREMIQSRLTLYAALIAQRIMDEGVRVRWFRGPLGRELSRLAGTSNGGRGVDDATGSPTGTALGEDDARLLWLLIEARTNREIASELEVSEYVVARQLAEMYARIGVSSRGEAAVLAFREGMV